MEAIIRPWFRETLHRVRNLRSPPPSHLPPEIWQIILLYAIEVPFAFDTICESKDFHRFITVLVESAGDFGARLRYSEAESERKKLRLVCKRWAVLLDSQSMRWVADHEYWRPNGRGIKRLDIRGATYRASDLYEPLSIELRLRPKEFPSILALPQTRSSLSTIRIDFLTVVSLNDITKIILDQVPESVRAFGYKISHMCPHYLIEQLQTRFSCITTLDIEAAEVAGPLRLEKLETLYLDISKYDADNWWFPSLKHCALGSRVIEAYGLKTSMIPGPAHQIRSLYLRRLTSPVFIEETIWQDLPQLEFLGGCAQWMVIVDSALLDHPLIQLALDDFVPSEDTRLYLCAEEMIKKVPNLRRFSLEVPNPNSEDKDGRMGAACVRLFNILRARRVDWTDQEGSLVRYERLSNYVSFTNLEWYALFLCYLHAGMKVWLPEWLSLFLARSPGHVLLFTAFFVGRPYDLLGARLLLVSQLFVGSYYPPVGWLVHDWTTTCSVNPLNLQ